MKRLEEPSGLGNRPTILAGSLVQALHDMEELGLQTLSVPAILKRLSVSRSQAYEWAQRHRNWREARPGPGRPQKEASLSTQTELQSLLVVEAMRDFLMTHPGAACPGAKRMVYSDDFRSYVLDLAATNTDAQRLTQEQLAKACGIPLHTLVSWLAGGRLATAPGRECCAPAPELAVDSEAPDTPAPTPADLPTPPEEACLPTAKWAAGATQVLELWTKWRGKFRALCASLPGHGIHMSPSLVRSILVVSGKRPQRRRRGRNLDAEAIRGELVRL